MPEPPQGTAASAVLQAEPAGARPLAAGGATLRRAPNVVDATGPDLAAEAASIRPGVAARHEPEPG